MNLAWVACGAVDAYSEVGIHCWDVCAGVVLIGEAGGWVRRDAQGRIDLMSRRVLAAGTGALGQALSEVVVSDLYEGMRRDDEGA